jgi:hypothetical protein
MESLYNYPTGQMTQSTEPLHHPTSQPNFGKELFCLFLSKTKDLRQNYCK